MNEVARYTFHVNSNQRSSGTNTDFKLDIKNIQFENALTNS